MKKTHFFLYLAATLFILAASAQVGTAAETAKIGSVNIQSALDNSEAGKKALAELKAKAEKEKDSLEKKVEAIKKLEKEIESQRLVAKEGALVDKEQELKRLRRDLEAAKEDSQSSFGKMQAQIMRKLVGDINRIIKEYAKKNGFTLIVEKGESPTMIGGFVLYVDDTVDLTSTIVKIYDEEQKAGKK